MSWSWWGEKIIVPIAAAVIGVGASATGAVLASPSPSSISCIDARAKLVTMYEQDHTSIDQPFPANSPEEEQCKVNEFENMLERGSG